MRLLICAATEFEISPTFQYLQSYGKATEKSCFRLGNIEISRLITGVGAVAMATKCMHTILKQEVDLMINAGIAGSFTEKFKIGDTCLVVKDRFGDLGTSHADGSFSDVFDMGLESPDAFPFQQGWLTPEIPETISIKWPKASAVTVNKVTGHATAIQEMASKYQVDLESMEGAGFFMAGMLAGIEVLQLRTVSNYVTPRDTSTWNIPLAIQNLNQNLIEIIRVLA
jgi:futalosine hydrolase